MRQPSVNGKLCSRLSRDEGQVSILVVLAVGTFLLLFAGFGVDMTNLFFHRQTAQNAADAACVAAGMDMLINQTNGGSSLGGFTRGAAFDCSGNATSAPCKYAALNGYSSPSATPLSANTETNGVHVSFPGSVPGATADTTITGANPFVQVDVYDGVKVYFSSLLSGTSTQTVHALAKCGLQNSSAPIPIIVLDPICTHAFEIQDTSATLQVIGGPSKSVQVNSSNSTCAAATQQGGCSSGGTINLQYGGSNFTGSNFGVFGAPGTTPTNFLGGTTGSWQSPSSPIADPWANLIAPAVPAVVNPPTKLVGVPPYSTTPGHIQYEDGCPDLTSGCTEYSPGLYTNPIVVIGFTAIFDPGVYYITGSTSSGGYCSTVGKGCITAPHGQCRAGFVVDSNGVVRPADPTKAPGDGSYGTLFYFSNSGGGNYESAFFGANAGKANNRTIDNFPLSIGSNPNYPGLGMNCPGASAPQQPTNPSAPQLPASFAGDIVMGPCTGPSGTIPSIRLNYSVQGTDAVTKALVNYHGMLMWDDRANNDINGQPSLNGGGGLLIAGNLYFHNCPEAPSECAAPPTDYNATFSLGGNSGSSTYIFGNITTDELVQTGGGTITMELNPNLLTTILKVALLQ